MKLFHLAEGLISKENRESIITVSTSQSYNGGVLLDQAGNVAKMDFATVPRYEAIKVREKAGILDVIANNRLPCYKATLRDTTARYGDAKEWDHFLLQLSVSESGSISKNPKDLIKPIIKTLKKQGQMAFITYPVLEVNKYYVHIFINRVSINHKDMNVRFLNLSKLIGLFLYTDPICLCSTLMRVSNFCSII